MTPNMESRVTHFMTQAEKLLSFTAAFGFEDDDFLGEDIMTRPEGEGGGSGGREVRKVGATGVCF